VPSGWMRSGKIKFFFEVGMKSEHPTKVIRKKIWK